MKKAQTKRKQHQVRKKHLWLSALAFFPVGLVFLLCIGFFLLPSLLVDRKIRGLEVDGQPTSIEALDESYTSKNNAAPVFVAVIESILSGWPENGDGLENPCGESYGFDFIPDDTAAVSRYRAVIAAHADQMRRVTKMSTMDRCDFLSKDVLSLEFLWGALLIANLLELQFELALLDNDTEKAVRSIVTLLSLSTLLGQDGLSHRESRYYEELAVRALRKLTCRRGLSKDQTARLRSSLLKTNGMEAFNRTVLNWRAATISSFRAENPTSRLKNPLAGHVISKTPRHNIYRYIYKYDESLLLDVLEAYEKASRLQKSDILEEIEMLEIDDQVLTPLAVKEHYKWRKVLMLEFIHLVRRDQTLLSLAIEEYYQDHEEYPSCLENVNMYLDASAIRDPFSGGMYAYKAIGDGYRIEVDKDSSLPSDLISLNLYLTYTESESQHENPALLVYSKREICSQF